MRLKVHQGDAAGQFRSENKDGNKYDGSCCLVSGRANLAVIDYG